MTKYLISFPAPAMNVPETDLGAVGEAAHAVIREAKHAGIYVFAGGINATACRCPQELREFQHDPES
jgi:hypothetical protein